MDLNKLYSDKRSGMEASVSYTTSDPRTKFQRDFDRIIFSSPFRRLQNKTQVFPLPGSVFVHNRLTHSLEVASLGRSFGTLIGDFIADTYKDHLSDTSKEFYRHSLYNVIAAACLCHDIGNPAFGHSGEDAIASFFIKNESAIRKEFSDKEWADFINFEGNANAIRVLTHQQQGKSNGGFQLTYATLAAIMKYPCESTGKKKGITHRKKFGAFQSELATFKDIADTTCMVSDGIGPLAYKRHPFVWLVEAADDICYNIIDLEDAHRLNIIDTSECIDLLLAMLKDLDPTNVAKVKQQLDSIPDKNEKIAYLRAKSIHILVMSTTAIYTSDFEQILDGTFQKPLFDCIADKCVALKQITVFSRENIYNHRSVVEIENAGYNVMYKLLSHFIFPVLKEKEQRAKSEEKALQLIPKQFIYEGVSAYERVMGVLDFVSGMTDNYATDLYRKIKGIDIGMTGMTI